MSTYFITKGGTLIVGRYKAAKGNTEAKVAAAGVKCHISDGDVLVYQVGGRTIHRLRRSVRQVITGDIAFEIRTKRFKVPPDAIIVQTPGPQGLFQVVAS